MRLAGHIARIGEKRNAYRILLGISEAKRRLGRPRHKCLDNIKVCLGDIRLDGVDWIDLAQDSGHSRAVVNTVMNLRIP
jgi:hypothetical protein